MSGLHALSRGRILLDGRPVTGPRPNEIGMIFQEANLLPWRNLRQNIRFPFEIKRAKMDEQRVDTLLGETGLAGFEHAYPARAVGRDAAAGVDRAGALAQDPAVLLMDEPFGALDAFTRDEMNLLLLRLWAETGKTIVFVTHNISEAIFLADRVVVMTPRPGRLARIFEIDLPRPRTIEMTFEPRFHRADPGDQAGRRVGRRPRPGGRVSEVPKELRDEVPTFEDASRKGEHGPIDWTGLTSIRHGEDRRSRSARSWRSSPPCSSGSS